MATRVKLAAFITCIPIRLLSFSRSFNGHDTQMLPVPGDAGPCTFEHLDLNIQGIQTSFYHPEKNSCGKWITASYAGMVFAHGFSMRVISNGFADVAGHAELSAELGVVGWYADPGVIAGQRYDYKVCSFHHGGNEHRCSEEISLTAGEGEGAFLPLVIRH